LREVRGEADVPAQGINAEQLYMQHRLEDEMVRLTLTDEQLSRDVLRLVNARQALGEGRAPSPDDASVSRQVEVNGGSLPYGARRVIEVQMGGEAWNHGLVGRTFTLGDVSGDVGTLEIRCDQGRDHFDYQADSEWSLPAGWTRCLLRIHAKPGATFRLYEFD
jgi:hypothetical protein